MKSLPSALLEPSRALAPRVTPRYPGCVAILGTGRYHQAPDRDAAAAATKLELALPCLHLTPACRREQLARYEKAGGRFMVCPVCFNAKQLDKGNLLPNAELAGSVQLWDWIGDGATTFSY